MSNIFDEINPQPKTGNIFDEINPSQPSLVERIQKALKSGYEESTTGLGIKALTGGQGLPEPYEPKTFAEKALQAAVAKTLKDHKREGLPIVVWRGGKLVTIPARQIRTR